MDSEKPFEAISEAKVMGLASIGATEQEICDYLGIGGTELMQRFGPALRRQWAIFKISIRQKQFNLAMDKEGDFKMLQWLGRFNLNQRDSVAGQGNEMPVKGYIGIDPDAI